MADTSIESLSLTDLGVTSRLVDTLFSKEVELIPSEALRASLEPEKYDVFWKKFNLTYLHYWVALLESKVVGITGLYGLKKDAHEALWLSWFCVDPVYRKHGIGSQLLIFTEEEAKRLGAKCLRLYTSTNPEEAVAQHLYEERNYVITGTEQLPHELRVYREKKL